MATTPAGSHTGGLGVALIDESPLMRDAVGQALDDGGDMRVVVDGGSAGALLDRLPGLEVDIIVMDPWPQGGGGLVGMTEIMRQLPGATFIALSSDVRPDHVQRILDRGAHSYIGKDVASADLAALLRQAYHGAHIHPSVARAGTLVRLSPREVDVLERVGSGQSNAEVADELFLTQQTVKFHLRNINRKLRASNRTEAVHLARRAGLIG